MYKQLYMEKKQPSTYLDTINNETHNTEVTQRK